MGFLLRNIPRLEAAAFKQRPFSLVDQPTEQVFGRHICTAASCGHAFGSPEILETTEFWDGQPYTMVVSICPLSTCPRLQIDICEQLGRLTHYAFDAVLGICHFHPVEALQVLTFQQSPRSWQESDDQQALRMLPVFLHYEHLVCLDRASPTRSEARPYIIEREHGSLTIPFLMGP